MKYPYHVFCFILVGFITIKVKSQQKNDTPHLNKQFQEVERLLNNLIDTFDLADIDSIIKTENDTALRPITVKLSDIPDEWIKDSTSNEMFVSPLFINGSLLTNRVVLGGRERDWRYFAGHPEHAFAAALSIGIAKDYSKNAAGSINGPADAIRHTMAAALLTKALGPSVARTILANHEDETNPDAMDIHNNEVGVQIGMANPNASPSQLYSIVLQKMEAGELVYKPTLPLAPSKPAPASSQASQQSSKDAGNRDRGNNDGDRGKDKSGNAGAGDKTTDKGNDKAKVESKSVDKGNDNRIGDGKPTKLP